MSDEIEVVKTDEFIAEVVVVPPNERARIERRLRTLRKKGWSASIKDRTVAPLRDGIYEVRVLGRGTAYRLLFCLIPGRSPRVVLLTTCVAKSLMTKKALLDAVIARAQARCATWLQKQEEN